MPVQIEPGPKFRPSEAIVPIVGLSDRGGSRTFLGTGFLLADSLLITCDHVLTAWDGAHGIAPVRLGGRSLKANLVARDELNDLAALRVEGYTPEVVLELAEDADLSENQHVCSYEYGTTIVADGKINLHPATRIGNITRQAVETPKGKNLLEVSFPALRGASGAPIVPVRKPLSVWGIVKGNVAYELHPAQVEEVFDAKGTITEAMRYYLPQAVAVHVQYIRELVKRCR